MARTVRMFMNRQTSVSGNVHERHLIRRGKDVYSKVLINGQETELTPVGLSKDPIGTLLTSQPDLLIVGTGITEIEFGGKICLHDLLGILVVQDPTAEVPLSTDWMIDPDESNEYPSGLSDDVRDEWIAEDGEVAGLQVGPGLEIFPRWIRINEYRGIVVAGEDFAAVALVDAVLGWPHVTERLLDWGFYSESGGPVSWDGQAELGWCGPRLWVFRRSGDLDPSKWIYEAPHIDEIHVDLANFIREYEWELPFILNAAGTPGLSEETRAKLHGARDVEGPWVNIHLTTEMNARVLDLLRQSWSSDWREMIGGLTNPESERGRIVYAWLNQIAHGPYQTGSWNRVHAAMIGEPGLPDPDESAPTAEGRFRDADEVAMSAVGAAQGWAPRIRIDDELIERVESVEEILTDVASLTSDSEFFADLTSVATVAAARAVLQLEDGDGLSAAWRSYERLAAVTPKSERHLNDAYWVLARLEERREALASTEQALANARTIEALALAFNWPAEWPSRYVLLWKELGGTSSSARAWASAGWMPRDILTVTQLRTPWNAEVADRVRTTDVPLRPSNFQKFR